MSETRDTSCSEGTIAIVCTLPWPIPSGQEIAFYQQTLADGAVILSVAGDGRLKASLRPTDQGRSAVEIASCKCFAPHPADVILFVIWNYPALHLHLNGTLLASTDGSEPKPEFYTIKTIRRYDGAEASRFANQNAAAKKLRRDKLAGLGGSPVHPSRRRAGAGQITVALRNEMLAIRDAAESIRNGSAHNIVVLANSLRKLLVDGKPLPLLQLWAATRDLPLNIYTHVGPFGIIMPLGSYHADFSINISPAPTSLNRFEADIDVWLAQRGMSSVNTTWTNRDVLKKIGDTLGSHFDIDVHKIVDLLMSAQFEREIGSVSMLTSILLAVSDCAVSLYFSHEQ